MDLIQAICLAVLQGVTEFLPISSSAHLILPAALTDWPDQGLTFDIAVHLGSLTAVIVYFREQCTSFVTSSWRFVTHRESDEHFELLLKLMLATVPIAVLGFFLKDAVETHLRTIHVIATTTILFGGVLWLADTRRGTTETLTWQSALVIGLAQAIAIIPGTSRSGITISAALLLGLSRTTAARIAFLLSLPAISGASLLAYLDQPEGLAANGGWHLAVGASVAGLSAYLCVRYFIALVERTGMLPYVVYRMLLGIVLFAIAFEWF